MIAFKVRCDLHREPSPDCARCQDAHDINLRLQHSYGQCGGAEGSAIGGPDYCPACSLWEDT